MPDHFFLESAGSGEDPVTVPGWFGGQGGTPTFPYFYLNNNTICMWTLGLD